MNIDANHYNYVVAQRAVGTVDLMTIRWVKLPDEFLQEVAERVMNKVEGVSRVIPNKWSAIIE